MVRSFAGRAEVRMGLAARGSRCLLVVLALLAVAACSDDSSPKVDAAIISAATDAGAPAAVDAVVDAGSRPAAQRFLTATAELTALEAWAPDGGALSLGGTAGWRTTSEGVDLEITLRGCVSGTTYELSILDARDTGGCARVASSGMERALHHGLPIIQCFGLGGGSTATTGYERSAAGNAPWTIGSGSASDLVGKLLIVRDGALGKPLACGVIARAEDVERSPMPPVDQAPTIAARATIGGVCLGRMYPGSSARCFDNEALLRCEAVHCEIGSCLQSCETYANCLDQESDVCRPAASCDLSPDCELCMSNLQRCSKLFCAEHSFCGASPTPDGPCHRLANCSALQGTAGDVKMAVLVPLVAGLGGDVNCVGSMTDWAVASQWKVPCLFGDSALPATSAMPPPSTQEPARGGPLADGRAGAACNTDLDCSGGRCLSGAKQGAAAGADARGYCTRACDTTSQCGRGGKCAGSDTPEGRQCLAVCNEQADCREGFVCTGRVQGSGIVLSGACHPLRQPEQLADHVAGRACQVDADCGGATCSATNLLGTAYPGNYCTGRCYEDTQCGQGGVCLWTRSSDALGFCLASCRVDTDCARDDYGCWDMSDGTRVLQACYPQKRPLPDRRAGQPCTLDADCGAPHATCAKQLPYEGLATNERVDVPGGYCTQSCALDRECGEGAQCINYGTAGGLCLASCTSDAPCRAGYACFAHARDNDETASVCVAGS